MGKKKKTKSQRMAKARRNAKKKRVMRFRSSLEEQVIRALEEAGVEYGYETEKVPFIQPAKSRIYNPDILLTKADGSCMYIEVKGKLDIETRQKHQWLKEQYPNMDLRFVFGNWNNKIMKGSKTSYKDWAEKLRIPCANKLIPIEWLEELL